MSTRTIDRWASPVTLESGIDTKTNTTSTPSISIASTWFEPTTGFHHAKIMCYNCESWDTSNVSLTSFSQPWIWASGPYQQTQTSDTEFALTIHRAKGVKYLNMASAFEASGEMVLAQVDGERISFPVEDVSDSPIETEAEAESKSEPEPQSESEPEKTEPDVKPEPTPKPEPKHHKHKLLGVVSIHGMLLVFSFFTISIGTLGIRSGFAKSFKLHWVIQAIGGTGIVIGCLMGIWLSYAVRLPLIDKGCWTNKPK
jgi:hypothetical protein